MEWGIDFEQWRSDVLSGLKHIMDNKFGEKRMNEQSKKIELGSFEAQLVQELTNTIDPFIISEYPDAIFDMVTLKQTGPVEEFSEELEGFFNILQPTEEQCISVFINNLKPNISKYVSFFCPKSFDHALKLAKQLGSLFDEIPKKHFSPNLNTAANNQTIIESPHQQSLTPPNLPKIVSPFMSYLSYSSTPAKPIFDFFLTSTKDWNEHPVIFLENEDDKFHKKCDVVGIPQASRRGFPTLFEFQHPGQECASNVKFKRVYPMRGSLGNKLAAVNDPYGFRLLLMDRNDKFLLFHNKMIGSSVKLEDVNISFESGNFEVNSYSQMVAVCEEMDSERLYKFISNTSKNLAVLKEEIPWAWKAAVSPIHLVSESLEGLYLSEVPNVDRKKDSILLSLRRTGILLMECLSFLLINLNMVSLSALIFEATKDQAKLIVAEWKLNWDALDLDASKSKSLEVHAFLQILATFDIAFEFNEELSWLIPMVFHNQQTAEPCLFLGLSEKMPSVIEVLVHNGKQIDAVNSAFAFELMEFSPVPLLKSYLNKARKAFSPIKPGNASSTAQIEDSERGLTALKAAIKCIEEHMLKFFKHIGQKLQQNFEEYKVCGIRIGVVQDVYHTLDDPVKKATKFTAITNNRSSYILNCYAHLLDCHNFYITAKFTMVLTRIDTNALVKGEPKGLNIVEHFGLRLSCFIFLVNWWIESYEGLHGDYIANVIFTAATHGKNMVYGLLLSKKSGVGALIIVKRLNSMHQLTWEICLNCYTSTLHPSLRTRMF